ncbi:Rne/Rng family ribonuclease [Bdellovibrionota bacterium FG-1]
MSTELIINASLPETRIALMENGEIQDLLIERATGKGIVGNIYKGRVTRVLPGMQAAFVDIGLEKAAFLYVDDVHVHSEIWEAEEGETSEVGEVVQSIEESESESGPVPNPEPLISPVAVGGEDVDDEMDDIATQVDVEPGDEEDSDEGSGEPVGMCPPPGDGSDDSSGHSSDAPGGSDEKPEGTLAPETAASPSEGSEGGAEGGDEAGRPRRHRRGRRGGRFRKRAPRDAQLEKPAQTQITPVSAASETLPDSMHEQVADDGEGDSDRSALSDQVGINDALSSSAGAESIGQEGRPTEVNSGNPVRPVSVIQAARRPEFKEPRSKDRRIKSKPSGKPPRGQANIQDLLKEGQEVIVQVAKDPIATKGARLTCHISLPGRHLVCMPTIDHVGVSRRIERDDERRKLREYVERSRPKGLGFIVRTASGRGQSEKRIKQDVEYLSRLWGEIREKASQVTAPALVYEDLNSVLRAIRDWVTEDIDKIVVDSRYHYNEIQRFVSHFMPLLKQKVELYHGDVPIFDAYNISIELARALERKVWLKSGGYLVVDQAEALVAIDVNTGRFVGKKNLEDTILKTNLEAVLEIAYQLRLRNCGGIIILDLIDMEKEENKQRVYRALEEALKKDRARPTILKISELGLVEMTRKRTRDTMVRALCDSCSHCEGKGFVKGKLTLAYEIFREIERIGIEREFGKVLIQAHPDVIDILAIDERETVDQLERRYRKQIYLQAMPDFHLERFEVIGDKQDKGDRVLPQTDRENGRDRDRGRNRNRGSDRNRSPGVVQPRSPAVDGMAYAGPGSSESVGPVALVVPRITPITPVNGVNPVASATPSSSVSPVLEGETPQTEGRGPMDDDYSEEDRLAFLRAQATQDAALARLGAGGGTPAEVNRRPVSGRNPPAGAGDEDPDGRRGRRGRRGGGRQRRDVEPRSPSGPKAGGRPKILPLGVSPINPSALPVIVEGSQTSNLPVVIPNPPENPSSGGGSNSEGNGGGGDHSTPPA